MGATPTAATVIHRVTTPDNGAAATDDTELIAASLVEPARFAELFDRHFPAIHRFLRRRVGPELADDLAAETFTQAFARRRHYRAEHPDAGPWLYGIAGNLLRQHVRAEQRRLRAYERVPPDLDTHDPGDGVAERVDASAAGRRAAAVLADLPADQREVLLLHAWAIGHRRDRPSAQPAGRDRAFAPAPDAAAAASCARLDTRAGTADDAPDTPWGFAT